MAEENESGETEEANARASEAEESAQGSGDGDPDWGDAMAEQAAGDGEAEEGGSDDGDPDWGDAMAEQKGEGDDESGPSIAVHAAQGNRMDQDSIDEMLGNQSRADDEPQETDPFRRLASVRATQREHLPMLDVIFEQLTRHMSNNLRGMISEIAECSLEDTRNLRFGDFLREMSLPALIGVIRIPEWREQALVSVDTTLVYAIVDMLLGGRNAPPSKAEGRPYTEIERSLVRQFLQVVLDSLSQAFEAVVPVTFELDRLESQPAFAAITRENTAAIKFSVSAAMGNRDGRLDFVIPYGTLEPVRDKLAQVTMTGAGGSDEIWHRHFGSELPRARADIRVILDEAQLTVRDLMELQPGATLALDTRRGDSLRVRANGKDVFMGRMVTQNERYAVEIDGACDGGEND